MYAKRSPIKYLNSSKAFGGYPFPKSHAAAFWLFAVLVYRSAWLKHYWPAQFCVALSRNQPMGFWTPAVLVNDARRHGIKILGVDVNRSSAECTVEDGSIGIGLNYVLGVGEAQAEKIERLQQDRVFTEIGDFCQRTRLSRRLVEISILAGAMDGWGIDRRKLLWNLGRVGYGNELGLSFADDGVQLKSLSEVELMLMETKVMGLSMGEHLMSFYGEWMKREGVLGSREVTQAKDGQKVQIAGEIVMHQSPPTAKGYHFITLEDKDGMMNVIVRPSVYRQIQILYCAMLHYNWFLVNYKG